MTSSPTENSTAMKQESAWEACSAQPPALTQDRASGQRQHALRVKVKLGLFIALLAIHGVISWIAIVPGYLPIDEACWNWIAGDFSATGLALTAAGVTKHGNQTHSDRLPRWHQHCTMYT